MKFSIVLIAKNEEQTLPKLMESLKEFRQLNGEVVLLDTGSNDKTAELARSYGAKVEEVGDKFIVTITKEQAEAINKQFIVEGEEYVLKEGDRIFDYSSARNYASALASNDFVFSPDCDEAFTKFDLQAINKAIDEGTERLEYEFIFSHDAQGNPGIRFMHSKAFDRRKFKWENIIHETLQGSGKTSYLSEDKVLLEHFQDVSKDRSSYLRGLALDLSLNPDNDRNLHYFARELYWHKRYKSAIKLFEKHIAMKRWPMEASQSAIFMGDCYRELGQLDDAVDSYHKAIRIYGQRREPYIRLAEFYQAQNNPAMTMLYALTALEVKRSNFYAENESMFRHIPHELLAWSMWWTGRKPEAYMHWRKALDFEPTRSKLLHDARYHEDLPKVDIIVPHLSLWQSHREAGLKALKDSIAALNYPQELITVTVDDSDATVPVKVNKMVSETSNPVICFMANDVVMEPDSLIQAVLTMKYKDKSLVGFNDGTYLPDRGNQSAHFIIKREFIQKLENKQLFSEDFYHVGCDNWLMEQSKNQQQFAHCLNAKIQHNHFSTTGKMDEVYRRGWKNAEKDRETLKNKLETLNK